MNNRTAELSGSNLKIFSPSITQSAHCRMQDFIAKRFYALSASFNNTILIGSSLAYQHSDIESEQVLDAAASAYICDQNHVIIGIKQATADGLGGSPTDIEENESIAQISRFSCETFIKSDNTSDETYHQIAKQSNNESHCAMASAKCIYSGDGKYQGEISNVGDTTIMILSSDLHIKKILPALQNYRGFGTWTPSSVQMLKYQPRKTRLITEKFEANEGDLIISMTDGVWSELPHVLNTKKGEIRTITLDNLQFEKSLNQANLDNNFYTCDLGLKILQQAMTNSLINRNILIELIKELQSIEITNVHTTVNEMLDYLKQNDKNKTAELLYNLLFNSGSGDGVTYHQDVEIPFHFVMKDLLDRTAGDCSTINITRIPYHLDELISAYILNPDVSGKILKELRENLASIETIKDSIARLKQEVSIIKPKLFLDNIVINKVFNEAALNELEILLIDLHNVDKLIRANKEYKPRIQAVSDYMSNMEIPMRTHLYELIRNDLSPPFSLLSFFYNDNSSPLDKLIPSSNSYFRLT